MSSTEMIDVLSDEVWNEIIDGNYEGAFEELVTNGPYMPDDARLIIEDCRKLLEEGESP